LFFPPLILATTIVLGCLLQWPLPLGFLASFGPSWRMPIGVFAIAAGISLAVMGRRLLTRLGTNVSPLRRQRH